ncbi:MAG: zinc-finger domain-containing protein [Pseudomonadota bacterium]
MADTARSPHQNDVEIVEHHRVSCNGGGGALGHPKVFYELGDEGEVICGYCGRHFIFKGGPADPDR